jgi:hypothetical protein
MQQANQVADEKEATATDQEPPIRKGCTVQNIGRGRQGRDPRR